jgi:hypothetical protein
LGAAIIAGFNLLSLPALGLGDATKLTNKEIWPLVADGLVEFEE